MSPVQTGDTLAQRKTSRSTTRSRTTAKTTRTVPATPAGRKHFVFGTLWIVVGVILLAYFAYGLFIYLVGPTDGFTRLLTNVFWYPAASVTTPDYLWWFILSAVMTFLLLGTFFKLIYLGVTGRWRNLGRLVVTGFVFVTSLVALLNSVPSVSTAIVGYNGYLERYETLKQFQEKQKSLSQGQQQASTPSEDETKALALQQLVINNIISQEGVKFDINVTNTQISDVYNQQATRNQGEENLRKQLKDLLGWSPGDFKHEISYKLIQEKLNEKLATDDDLNKDQRKKAEDVLKQVKDEKKDFAEVAKANSDDPTSQAGGDQGTVRKGESDPALENELFKLQPGEVSGVIKSQRGYAIVRVNEKPSPEEVKYSLILIRTKSLADFIPDELKNATVKIFVDDLTWNPVVSSVQPKKQTAPQPSGTEPPIPTGSGAPAAAPPAAQPAQPVQ
jgi:parvulin-like peptidyl-prolyl isomerase